MIDGLKIRMASEELASRIAERIQWNDAAAARCEAERLESQVDPAGAAVPEHMLEHEIMECRERVATLRLLHDHLVAGEVYELDEGDLRFADLVSDGCLGYLVPRRPHPAVRAPLPTA